MSNSTSNKHASNPFFEQLEPRLLLSYGTVGVSFTGPALYDGVSIQLDADRDLAGFPEHNYPNDTDGEMASGEYMFDIRNTGNLLGDAQGWFNVTPAIFTGYCIDVPGELYIDNVTHEYKVVDLEEVVIGGSVGTAYPTGRLLGEVSAKYLREFFARNLASLDIGTTAERIAKAEAFGAGLWEIVYEDPGDYDLNAGFLIVGNLIPGEQPPAGEEPPPTLAQGWLDVLTGAGVSEGVVFALVSVDPTFQGVAFVIPASGGSDPLSTVQGMVWQDINNDGSVDSDEKAIGGVTVHLTGTDDLGNDVDLTDTTDADGVYAFYGLRPSDGDGYTIEEDHPDAFEDGLDVLGTVQVNGGPAVPVGDADPIDPRLSEHDDMFSGIVITQMGSIAENYNFGEGANGELEGGQTATIGFWQNKNGQSLIKGLNGDEGDESDEGYEGSTLLGDWLADNFPNMYGANAGANDLTGKDNAFVADFYSDLFRRKKKDAAQLLLGGPMKMDAQVMATALATYVTNQALVEVRFDAQDPQNPEDPSLVTKVESYGFQVDSGGGFASFNLLSETELTAQEAADLGITLDAYGNATIMDILLATDRLAVNGVLYDLDGNGDTYGVVDGLSEDLLRTLANEVYTAINEGGDIG